MRKALAGERAFQSGSLSRGDGARAGGTVRSDGNAGGGGAGIAQQLDPQRMDLVLGDRGHVAAVGVAEIQGPVRGAGVLSNAEWRDAEQQYGNEDGPDHTVLLSNVPVETKTRSVERARTVYLRIASSSLEIKIHTLV